MNKARLFLLLIAFILTFSLSAQADLNFGFETDLGIAGKFPAVSFDRFGNIHLVWINSQNQLEYRKLLIGQWSGSGPVPYDANIPQTVPVPGQVNIENGQPAIAPDRDGYPHIVWGRDNSARQGPIYYTKFDGSSWLDPPETVTQGRFEWVYDPDIALDSYNVAHVIASGVNDPSHIGQGPREILYKNNSSGNWLPGDGDPSVVISEAVLDSKGGAITVDSSDDVHVAWNKQFQSLTELAYRKKAQGVWDSVVNPVRHNDFVGPVDIVTDKLLNPHFSYPTFFNNFGMVVLEGINYTRYVGLQWLRDNFNRNLMNALKVETRIANNDQGACVTWNDMGVMYYYFNDGSPTAARQGSQFPTGSINPQGIPVVAGRGNYFYFFFTDFMGAIKMNSLLITEKAVGPPKILAGGYYDTQISEFAGGRMTLIAFVSDPNGLENIATVEIYAAGQPTGLFLRDDGNHGDFAARDGVYGFQIDLVRGLPIGLYLLEIRAVNHSGDVSSLFPYLHIMRPSNPAQPANEWDKQVKRDFLEHNWMHYYRQARYPKSTRVGVNPPRILVAGYLTTEIRTDWGGDFMLVAWATDQDQDLEQVELLVNNAPTGVFLKDDGTQGDVFAGDSIYALGTTIGPGAAPGDYLLEMRAKDSEDHFSQVWPYLNIVKGGTPTPTTTPTPTRTPTPNPGNLDCSNAVLMQCNVPYHGNSAAGGDDIEVYSCPNATFRGREFIHKITLQTGAIQIDMNDIYPRNLNFILLRACSENDCMAVGDYIAPDHKQLRLSHVAGGTYYIVVDGKTDNDNGEYTLNVTCNQGQTATPTPTPSGNPTSTPTLRPGQLNCDHNIQMECGDSYDGNTANGYGSVTIYNNCAIGKVFSGKEIVHEITKVDYGNLSAEITQSSIDLDVFILTYCSEAYCVEYGDNIASFDSAPPGIYYVVVDGTSSQTGTYSLHIDCQ